MSKQSKQLPAPTQYEIVIPDGLPELPGTLTRKQRVEVALDVVAVLRSRQRQFRLYSTYFESDPLPKSGQLHTSRIKGSCLVCARGMLFLKSVDRFNHFDLEAGRGCVAADDVTDRTRREWGYDQAQLIELAFEGSGFGLNVAANFRREHYTINQRETGDRKPLMIAICENIVANHGEFRP